MFGELGQADAALVIDLVGQLGLKIAKRIVGQGCQVDDGVCAVEVCALEILGGTQSDNLPVTIHIGLLVSGELGRFGAQQEDAWKTTRF